MQAFDILIGTWETEATHPQFDGGVVPGRVTFEWLEGGHYLIQRSTNDHELFPDGLCVIGPPEEGDDLLLEYFDSRGVRRTYNVSLEDGVLRWWRLGAGFDQRATGELRPDEWVFQTQLAETPGEWKDDLRAVFRRVE